MDVESKTTHQETEAKSKEDVVPKGSPNVETNGTPKESPKSNTRQKRGHRRSRSRTPQKKTDDSKTLHITLKKINSELNGKDAQEESVTVEAKQNGDKDKKTEQIIDKVNDAPTKEEKKLTENGGEQQEPKKDVQTQKQKDEKPKKEEAKKVNTQEKEKKGSKKESPKKATKNKQQERDEPEQIEMEPLVLSDEPDPELQFDDNSDGESGKNSPIITRCMTRRSQTRNIPTPKTPKSVDQDVESATHTPTPEVGDTDADLAKVDNLNETGESMDTVNYSTRAEAGSDATRMDYVEENNSNFEESSYINASREKSLSETLRGLSARRPIRPMYDYRTRVLRSNQEKHDLNLTGVKRKDRSITPEERKKFKMDSPTVNSLFSSPFANIRNKFKTDLPSSTPKLVSYRDTTNQPPHYDENYVEHGDDEKKSWCNIM